MHIDSSVGGLINYKELEDAHNFIKLLANNVFGWIKKDKADTKKQSGVFEQE